MVYSVVAAFGFAILYAESALAHSGAAAATLTGVAIFVLFAASFLVPPRLFRYTNDDVAPRVMSQVMARAVVAAAMVLIGDAIVWLLTGGSVALLEELFV